MSNALNKTRTICSFALLSANSHSFVMSNLSGSLTVAHLSWAIWANCWQLLIWSERSERMSDEWMREFPTLPKISSQTNIEYRIQIQSKNIEVGKLKALIRIGYYVILRLFPWKAGLGLGFLPHLCFFNGKKNLWGTKTIKKSIWWSLEAIFRTLCIWRLVLT